MLDIDHYIELIQYFNTSPEYKDFEAELNGKSLLGYTREDLKTLYKVFTWIKNSHPNSAALNFDMVNEFDTESQQLETSETILEFFKNLLITIHNFFVSSDKQLVSMHTIRKAANKFVQEVNNNEKNMISQIKKALTYKEESKLQSVNIVNDNDSAAVSISVNNEQANENNEQVQELNNHKNPSAVNSVVVNNSKFTNKILCERSQKFNAQYEADEELQRKNEEQFKFEISQNKLNNQFEIWKKQLKNYKKYEQEEEDMLLHISKDTMDKNYQKFIKLRHQYEYQYQAELYCRKESSSSTKEYQWFKVNYNKYNQKLIKDIKISENVINLDGIELNEYKDIKKQVHKYLCEMKKDEMKKSDLEIQDLEPLDLEFEIDYKAFKMAYANYQDMKIEQQPGCIPGGAMSQLVMR